MTRLAVLIGIVFCAAAASAQSLLFEDFDDQAHDLQTAGGSGHTIGGGVSSQSYAVEPDGGGFDLEMRLDLVSLASDESGGGSYVWPGARALVPELADASFVVESELTVDAAFAEGSNRSLSVGLVARCASIFNADSCPGFDANLVMRYYRLSYALVGEGTFTDSGAALASGDLRLVEYGGDGQVDATVPGLAVPAGTPFTMRLSGRSVGATLELVGEMTNGVAITTVSGVDPTPLTGPGFGVRTGGFVRGFGGANANGALEVDVDDLLVPEPSAAVLGVVAASCLFLRKRFTAAGGGRGRD